MGAAVRVPPDLTCGGLSNSAGWYMEHHPTAQKGKLSLRGAGLVKVVTLRGRVGKTPKFLLLPRLSVAGGRMALGLGRTGLEGVWKGRERE